MKHAGVKSSVTVPVVAQVSPRTKGRLEAVARRTRRSQSSLAAEAIENYLEVEAWHIREIKRSMALVRAGVPTIPHDKVAEWLDSWGTGKPLPPPRPAK